MSFGCPKRVDVIMKIAYLFACSLLVIAAPGVAQPNTIKATTENLKAALIDLQKYPGSAQAQQKYLKAFPRDYKTFLELFDLEGRELYDGHEYILILPSLAKNHLHEVGSILVELSKDAEYQADAPGYLQDVTADYARSYTRSFVRLIKPLTQKQRTKLIVFLADEEAIAKDPRYQNIIDKLRKLGELELAMQFESKRSDRARLGDH